MQEVERSDMYQSYDVLPAKKHKPLARKEVTLLR